MDEKKEVQLVLNNPAEEKALSRGTTRRRRGRKADGDVAGGAISVDRVQEPIPANESNSGQVAPAPAPVPSAPIIPIAPDPMAGPAVPSAALSATTVVGGAVPTSVKIQAKRTPEASAGPSAAAPAPHSTPKIIPTKKRISAAPAATSTLKKPKFVVGAGLGANNVPEVAATSTFATTRKQRKFSERKINLTVKPAVQTRRMRKTLKRNINAMPIVAVQKFLIRKGVLKPKATAPPEDMMRSMMRDYMLLHAAE
jgi:hypothetical protein